jgi:transcriptional regulator of met regulon
MNPTQKQVEALRKFRVPEEQIQALSIGQASEMLAHLVQRARSGNGTPPKGDRVLSQVSDNLTEAAKIVMEYFGLRDKSQLKEVHVALIQEMSRQVYGLKYWIEKAGYLKPNGD